ncbi:lutropin subunit beta isoform X1 [Rhinolophus sinicus]|uniref:lutropin subunit beta isoform X1 n=1 Tax=Rhinolophus sinicus TaxID=89399 RepID=UPI003D78FEBF
MEVVRQGSWVPECVYVGDGKGQGQRSQAGPEAVALSQGLLLWLLLSAGGVWTSRGPLRPLCRPINATLTAENEACPVCITFTTSICAGYCPSMVRVLPTALPPVPQPVCTYRELSFASIRLPGCPPGVDPMVSFPVALSCHCGPCRLSSSDCGGPKVQPLACDRPPLPDLLLL